MASTTGSGVQATLSITPGSTGESTFGTYAAATRGLEFISESLDYRKNIVQSMGLRGTGTTNLPLSSRRMVTTSDAGGDFEIELMDRGCGILLAHCMRSYPTKAAGAFTFTLGNPNTPVSFSTQVAVPQYDGDVTYKQLSGCQVASWELSIDSQGSARLKPTIDAAKYATGGTASSVTYANSGTYNPLHFANASIYLDGAGSTKSTFIRDFSLTVDNGLKTDRYNLDGSGVKQPQIASGFRKISGKFTAEFQADDTWFTNFTADTKLANGLWFEVKGTSSGTTGIMVKMPTVFINKADIEVKGSDVVDVDVEFEVLYDGSAEPLTLVYTTSDAAL